MLSKQVGLDLGTANLRVWVRGRGLIVDEPTVVALTAADERLVAIGHEAREMEERSPARFVLRRPVRAGVIADYGIAAVLLHELLRGVVGRFALVRPTVMVCVPAGATNVESRAMLEATVQAGAREVHLIPAPLAAAIGAGVPLASASGNLLVDVGAGTCQAAVLSLNDIVVSSTLRRGSQAIDDLIVAFFKRRHNLLIGHRTAEDLKVQFVSALPRDGAAAVEVRGVDQVSGLPRTATVTVAELSEAIGEMTAAIVGTVRAVLEQTPPELVADVADKGMILTGGGALLRDLDKLLARETGIPAYLADDPTACMALGAGKALEHLAVFRDSLLHSWRG